ncbi:diguanylate cyclase [Gammaproteobacteria bacterium]
MRTHWHKGILFFTTMVVVGIAMAVGTIFMARTVAVTHEHTRLRVTEGLSELLDTIESTASIACFVHDQTLAAEVVRGLLKNSTVLGVVIKTDKQELASNYRNTLTPQANQERLVRTIYSPFTPNEPVGQIEIYPNTQEIDRLVSQNVRFVATVLVTQLIALVIAIVFVVLRWVVNPIKGMSDYLHHMDATKGDRLVVPHGQTYTEVGRLAEDINALASRLVTSLEDEHQLRLRHEMDKKRYRAIFDNAETGIFIADQEGQIESANPALVRLFEFPDSTIPSAQRISDLTWVLPARPTELVVTCIENNSLATDDLEFVAANGVTRWLNLVLSPIGENRVQGLVSDITKRKYTEDLAKKQAVTDPLTGVANRPGFEQKLLSTIQQSDTIEEDTGFALIQIDVDGFKRINEALGLPTGDEVLKMVCKRICNHLRPIDTIARLGGDEFALILHGIADSKTVTFVSERLIEALEQDYNIENTQIKLGASIGITIYPHDGNDLPFLLRNAELALDHARLNGGNRFSFFDRSMAEAVERRRTMETDMQLALKRNEFSFFFQPIVDLTSNRLVGAEALIRWRHPEKGLVPPDAFIPLAEETGLIIDIGLWGLETACQQLANWKNEGKDYYLSINISGRQIPDGLPPATLAEAIQRHGIDASHLMIELTEGVLLSDVRRAQQWLGALREQGFIIYLDDFGTGYSSLSYLKRFPVNTIKVDKSFVRDMGDDTDDYALVEAIVVMARTLGMRVVAEGVENKEQLELLRRMQCRYAQGFFFSRPVPINEFDSAAERIRTMLIPKHEEQT